jgi:hypothetical protein
MLTMSSLDEWSGLRAFVAHRCQVQLLEMGRKVFGLVDSGQVEVVL